MSAALIHIQQTKEIANPWTHWYFYGASGSGKTTAAASFPDPLFLVPATEGSELTLAGTDREYMKIGRDANNDPVRPRDHMTAILSFLETQHAAMKKCVAEGDDDGAYQAFPWQTIVMESLTHYCAMLQDDVSNNGTLKMDQQRWGIISDHLRMLHSRLRSLECHVVFTSLAKVEGEGNAIEGAPDIPGKMARMLPSACDAIGFCEVSEPASGKGDPLYKVHFRQHRCYPARTRFRRMPGVVQNFDWQAVAKFTSTQPA